MFSLCLQAALRETRLDHYKTRYGPEEPAFRQDKGICPSHDKPRTRPTMIRDMVIHSVHPFLSDHKGEHTLSYSRAYEPYIYSAQGHALEDDRPHSIANGAGERNMSLALCFETNNNKISHSFHPTGRARKGMFNRTRLPFVTRE
jgi:hypothetical protein